MHLSIPSGRVWRWKCGFVRRRDSCAGSKTRGWRWTAEFSGSSTLASSGGNQRQHYLSQQRTKPRPSWPPFSTIRRQPNLGLYMILSHIDYNVNIGELFYYFDVCFSLGNEKNLHLLDCRPPFRFCYWATIRCSDIVLFRLFYNVYDL